MTFARRFRYYLIGVSLGFLIVFFIFRGKGFSWLPGNRVLIALQESTLYTTPLQDCLLDCYGISKNDVFDLIDSGTVNFKKSNPKGEQKEYLVESDKYSISFIQLNDTAARLNQVTGLFEKDCDCPVSQAQEQVIFTQPDQRIFDRLSALKFEYTKQARCQFECLALPTTTLDNLVGQGKIEHKLSLPRRSPNPLFCVVLQSINGEVAFMVEQGKEKARVLQVLRVRRLPEQGTVLENACACE